MPRNRSEKRTPLQACADAWWAWISCWDKGKLVSAGENARYNDYSNAVEMLSPDDHGLWCNTTHEERRELHASQ